MNPSQQIRTIVDEVGSKVLAPVRAALQQIDSEWAHARKTFAAAEESLRKVSDRLRRDLLEGKQTLDQRIRQPCNIDRDASLPELAITGSVPSRWQPAMSQALNLDSPQHKRGRRRPSL